LTVTRTDPKGCTNHLYGTLSVLRTPALLGHVIGLSYRITSSERGCDMGSGHTEARWWEK
jgi:hypothetical protein